MNTLNQTIEQIETSPSFLEQTLRQWEKLALSNNHNERYQASTFFEQLLPFCRQLLISAQKRTNTATEKSGIHELRAKLESNRATVKELSPVIAAHSELAGKQTETTQTILRLQQRLQTLLTTKLEDTSKEATDNVQRLSDPLRLLKELREISESLKKLGISI